MEREPYYDYMLRMYQAELQSDVEKPMAKVTAIQILKDAAELKERKSKDYQGGKWSEADYFPFGHESYIHMLWTKILRIRNVAEAEETNFESLEDSLLDIINYAAMYAAWIENEKEGL